MYENVYAAQLSSKTGLSSKRSKSNMKIGLLEAAQPKVHTVDQMIVDTYGHAVVCWKNIRKTIEKTIETKINLKILKMMDCVTDFGIPDDI